MRQRCGASQKTTIHRHAPTARCIAKTAEERFYMLARGWFAYPVTPVAHATTAEERFHTLARGWLAYPVTPAAHATTAEELL